MELEYVPCDICEVFKEIEELFSQQMQQKHIDFKVHTASVKNRFVWCDRKNLDRILFNLLSNACKFTPEGGSVSASILEEGSHGGYASYEISIRDSGIGMSAEFVEKMFNAFERERTSTVSGIEGTGLGLSITKSLLDLMGGTIDVLTSPGGGTEMIIKLKFRIASPDEVSSSSPQQEAREEADFTGKRLLVVEDNAINMEIACMILEQRGFTVETAENGQIAVDMVASKGAGYYDAVLMDIQMPVMDGYSATRAIRALDDKAAASVPILAMTANAFKEDEQAALEAGMQGHIAKPVDVEDLISKLSAVL